MGNNHPTYRSSFNQDASPLPDAQGQAALLLIESLMHSLLDHGVLTKAQAIDAIDSAVEVKEESAAEQKEPEDTRRKSLALLVNLRASIEAHSLGGSRPMDDAAG